MRAVALLTGWMVALSPMGCSSDKVDSAYAGECSIECLPCPPYVYQQFLFCDEAGDVWSCDPGGSENCTDQPVVDGVKTWRITSIPCECVDEYGQRRRDSYCSPE